MLDDPPDLANIIAILGEENAGVFAVVVLAEALEESEEESVEDAVDGFLGVLGHKLVAVVVPDGKVAMADVFFVVRTGLSNEMVSEEES